MHLRPRKPSGRLLLAVTAVVLAASLWAATASPQATASPPSSSIITLDQLQSMLNAATAGTITGYFKTIVGGSTTALQTPVNIPVTITSIVPNQTSDGSLILFQATGTIMDQIGGIAEGMSGSPMYVNDGSGDKLVGAVSYGDIFTLGGLGLATPIEYMTSIQNNYFTTTDDTHTATLAHPIKTASGTVSRIVTAGSAAAAKAIKPAAGTAVFSPLATARIGGLPPASAAYKALSAKYAAMGFDVQPTSLGVSPSGYDPNFTTTLTGGASLAVLYSRGDLWTGAAGTVTYVDGSTLLAFGHPLDQLGDTTAYLTNAWVSGIWNDSYTPYKIMAPSALRGTITQDRESGVAGLVGPVPVDTPVTSSATFNGKTVQSTSYVPQALTSSPAFADLPAYASLVPAYKALDVATFPGSATTTTTVVVNAGSQDLTLTRTNLWDASSSSTGSSGDVIYAASTDVANILETLAANTDGIAPATIKSVDFQASFSKAHKSARMISVSVAGGLKTGDNDVLVTLLDYGVQTPQTVHVNLNLPEGTPTDGTLTVYGGSTPSSGSGGLSLTNANSTFANGLSTLGDDRQTVADLVNTLATAPLNNDVVVSYTPNSGGVLPFLASSVDDTASATITATQHTAWVVGGDPITLPTSAITFTGKSPVVAYGAPAMIMGSISSVAGDTTVNLYRRNLGSSTYKLVDTLPAVASQDGATFSYIVPSLKTSAHFLVTWDGDDQNLGASADILVSSQAKVTLGASKTTVVAGDKLQLVAKVRPNAAGHRVVFERFVAKGKPWVRIAKAKLGSDSVVTVAWKPSAAGHYKLRASVGALATNAAGTSPVIAVTVK